MESKQHRTTPADDDVQGLLSLKMPKATAVRDISLGTSLPYDEFVGLRNRIANALIQLHNIKTGDRIAVYGHNSIEWLLLERVIRIIGAALVPINWHLATGEVQYLVENSECSAIFVGKDFISKANKIFQTTTSKCVWYSLSLSSIADLGILRPLSELIDAGSANFPPIRASTGTFLYTGGTSGKPKAVMRDGRPNPNGLALLQALGVAEPNAVHLAAAPLYHAAPLALASYAFMMGGSVCVLRRFDAQLFFEAVSRFRITTSFMPPILLKRLLALPEASRRQYDVSSLQSVVTGGAPCPHAVKEGIDAALGPVLHELYGSSELGINAVMGPADMLRKKGSCGTPVPGVQLKMVDEEGREVPTGTPGLLYVRRYIGMMHGYFKDPAKTARAFDGEWATVGDIAYVDEEGFVFICDRKIDMIISGAANIYPAEVEAAIHTHPAVADVAVFGTPDKEYGERVHAALKLRPGTTLTAAELKAFLRGQIAGYKLPRDVSFHATLPRSDAGKIRKRVLRDMFWKGESKL